MSEIGFLDLTCILIAAEVSAPATGPNQGQVFDSTFTLARAKQMEVGFNCLNEEQGEMVLRAGQDGWMAG